jgi:hypothetical protein
VTKQELDMKLVYLSSQIAQSILTESRRLGRTGAVDIEDYEMGTLGESTLAKILVTAAMENLAGIYNPGHSPLWDEELKNLRHL